MTPRRRHFQHAVIGIIATRLRSEGRGINGNVPKEDFSLLVLCPMLHAASANGRPSPNLFFFSHTRKYANETNRILFARYRGGRLQTGHSPHRRAKLPPMKPQFARLTRPTCRRTTDTTPRPSPTPGRRRPSIAIAPRARKSWAGAIADQFAAHFKGEPDIKLAIKVESIQFVSPNVAIEHGVATTQSSNSGKEEDGYSAVFVRRDGQWLWIA